jgi:hypothetical protein
MIAELQETTLSLYSAKPFKRIKKRNAIFAGNGMIGPNFAEFGLFEFH